MNLTPSAVAELLDEWVHGWAISRQVSQPSRLPVGFHLHVGAPGHRERYVLPRLEDLAEVAATVTRTETWIKVCAPTGSRACRPLPRVAPRYPPAT